MTKPNSEVHELSDNELDTVTGGGAIADTIGAAKAIGAAVGAIGGVNNVIKATIDGIPPAPYHTGPVIL